LEEKPKGGAKQETAMHSKKNALHVKTRSLL